ncbi:MAG: hypothetical protein J0H65_07405, partial [Rhizobiales bacterium]|nr:hypothetical protein [Hyphomicrobiales bacterium]
MGPHASLAVKKAAGPLPKKPDLTARTPLSSRTSGGESRSEEPGPSGNSAQPPHAAPLPTRTREIETEAEQKRRKGRPRKTGRPGH